MKRVCRTCNRRCHSLKELTSHWIEDHHRCLQCGDDHDDEDDLYEHRQTVAHSCGLCERSFRQADHMQQHEETSSAHDYCPECRWEFRSPAHLTEHKRIHMPRTIPCPSDACGDCFATNSHLFGHLEERRCPSNINSEHIHRVLRLCDPNKLVSDPNRPFIPPSNHRIARGDTRCRTCGIEFTDTHALRQHADNPASHQDEIYSCPCGLKKFRTVSGLIRHTECPWCELVEMPRKKELVERLVRRVIQKLVSDL